jgi:succinyl-diaminopimelate desuccinylase
VSVDPGLDLGLDAGKLTAVLVDIESVSGNEVAIADLVEQSLRSRRHLEVERDGNVVIARTNLGNARRIVLAGHLDTVPIASNVPSRLEGELLYGCGSCDMKSGVAVMLKLAASIENPAHDLSFVFYDCEEIEAARNGLGRLARERRDVLEADFAILLEPTGGAVEAGCQGTLRVVATVRGVRAHSARSWLGVNAIHATGELLRTLETYQPRVVEIDGCTYREGLNAVAIKGGVAGNVVPDRCEVSVNFRFAPDRSVDAAFAHVSDVLHGFDLELVDAAPGALPGLSAPVVADFVSATGSVPLAKLGWTDVARFAELGIPALNFGPGDPNLAHSRAEHVDVRQIESVESTLRRYLTPLR